MGPLFEGAMMIRRFCRGLNNSQCTGPIVLVQLQYDIPEIEFNMISVSI